MGYFNYFIKQFIRLFTKKFFWIIFIVLIFLFCKNVVFGAYVVDNGTISYTFPDLPEGNDNVTTYIATPLHPNSTWLLFNYSLTPNSRFICLGYENGLYNINCVDSNNQDVPYYTRACSAGDTRWREYYTHLSTTQMGSDQPAISVSLHDVKFPDGSLLIQGINHEVAPSISNSNSDIVNWSFDYLDIDMGTYDLFYTYIDSDVLKTFSLNYNYNGIDYSFGINEYLNVSLHIFSIPINALTNSINIRDNATITFSITAEGRFFTTETITLGSYELGSNLSENINEDSSKYVQSQILDETKKSNEELENINDTITNSNIDNLNSDTLPSDNTVDITRDGINGIFTSIYNAFCVGQPQDIVFPVPFTNKSFSLSPTYISDSLTASGASFIVLLIQAFWWYIISRFIVKDIADKLNKIKSGDIEKIENSNIKGDML